MTVISLPTAAYGKAPDGQDEYGVLWTQTGFIDAAQQTLRKLARAYQFLGHRDGGDNRYPDCYALWPVEVGGDGGGWLAARLRDAGRDTLGRPHTLRIDAVFINESATTRNRAELLGFLEATAWPPDSFEVSHTSFNSLPTTASPVVSRSVADFDPATSTQTILRAFHSHGTNNRFDIVLDAEGLPASGHLATNTVANIQARGNPEDASNAATIRGVTDTGFSPIERPRGGIFRLLATSVMALGIGIIAGFFWHKSQSNLALQNLQADLARREQQHEQELSEQLRESQDAYDIVLAQTRQLKEAGESFKELAAEYGFTNVSDLESELKKHGFSPRAGESKDLGPQKVRRLYDSLGAELNELFGPSTAPQPTRKQQQQR